MRVRNYRNQAIVYPELAMHEVWKYLPNIQAYLIYLKSYNISNIFT